METDVETVCAKCGKPVAKTGSITQWIFDTSKCACSNASEKETARCPLCNLPLKNRLGTITQWMFKPQVCSCLISTQKGFEANAEMPDDESIAGAPYHFIAVMARGGLGTVYQAQNLKLRRTVAVKVLDGAIDDTRASQNFVREARACSKLQHPNVLKVLDFGSMKDGREYLVTEWIEGITLAQYLSRHGTLSIAAAQEIFSQVLDGLFHAHNRGVVHRDIKPSNIMLTRSDSGEWLVRIIDFGTAKEIDSDGFTTRAEDLACSPFYVSPEQTTGLLIDRRSDLYSLGCTIFEALAGKPPFVGAPLAVVMRHQTEQPPTLSSAAGFEFPQPVEDFVSRLLAKSPSDRFETAEEAKSDLLSLPSKNRSSASGQGPAAGSSIKSKVKIAWLFVALMTVTLVVFIALTMLSTKKQIEFFGGGDRSKPLLLMPSTSMGQGIDDDEVSSAVDKRLRARTLELDSIQVSEKGLEPLKRCTGLSELRLTASEFPPGALKSIEGIPLRLLSLCSSNANDEALDHVAKIKSLKTLDLSDTAITTAGVAKLSELKDLRILNLGKLPLADHTENLSILSTFPLKDLELSGATINEQVLTIVSNCKSLKVLMIAGVHLTANDLKILAKTPNLEYLDLSNTDLKDNELLVLKTFPHLESIILGPKNVTEKTLKVVDSMPNLTHGKIFGIALVPQKVRSWFIKRHPDFELLIDSEEAGYTRRFLETYGQN